ncbi:PhoX family protein [Aliidiomarina sanyensis]|nr:PhoX family phosphatase [Aliidiomarina sanyensis]
MRPESNKSTMWRHDVPRIDNSGIDPQTNYSGNRDFYDVVNVNLSRRRFLQASLGGASLALLSACASSYNPLNLGEQSLAFSAIPISHADNVTVPDGYRAQAFLPEGSPLLPNAPEYKADGTNTGNDQLAQVGAHHDGMHFFPLDARTTGLNSDEGLLVMNHEYVDPNFLHAHGPTPPPRPADEVHKEMAAHGVSIAHIKKTGATWQLQQQSPLNRRITGYTPMKFSGPAAGHEKLITKYSPEGNAARGTLNNCAHGYTPWGTYLTCEENWARYFVNRDSQPKEHTRYGVGTTHGRYYWETASDAADEHRRFDATPRGASAHEDYRNEPNTFGWIVEIDPFNPRHVPVKHTALGRFAHEGVVFAPPVEGEPLVAYSGDDSRFEYIYKFVSSRPYYRANAGSHLLTEGTLYVARFNEQGRGEWLPLTLENLELQKRAMEQGIVFEDLGDLLINTRLAADLAGATPMDRPEWGAVHPDTGEVYFTLTNNTRRTAGQVDPANPRAENYAGHIIRWREQGEQASTAFVWDIFLFGGAPGTYTPATSIQLSDDNHHACADGLWFDSAGLLWIQTDMSGAIQGGPVYGNNGMLVADPNRRLVKRFLTGPVGCEITGVVTTPDRKTMFINVQHPGEGSTIEAPSSHWPGNFGSRPRSATVIITREDGGVIGT